MGLFSKKEKVPEIPPAPSLPEIPELPRQINELPSFPQNMKENINREMVKSAVDDIYSDKDVNVEELPRDFDFDDIEEKIPPLPNQSRVQEISQSIERELKEPIFVRIDKFQKSQKDFEQIKKKMKEIESVLGRIKEVKSKEDDEISSWSRDLEMMKSKLSEIDENIFNKL